MVRFISSVRIRWHTSLLISLCALILVGYADKAAISQPAFDFLQTRAARAFKTGDFQQAATEFRLLSQQYPEDTTILRYLAISLSQSGAFDAALGVFHSLLRQAPNNVAIQFYLGVTLYRAQKGDEAEQWFFSVIKLARESRYAEIARDYLDAISEQKQLVQGQGEPRPWGLYAQLGTQFSNNVPAAPSRALYSGERDDVNFSGYLSGTYYLLRSYSGPHI